MLIMKKGNNINKAKDIFEMFLKKISLIVKIYILSGLIFSCSVEDVEPEDQYDDTFTGQNPTQTIGFGVYAPTALGKVQTSPQTFGIRNDKKLSEYEAIATNVSPFNTDEFPDFKPVVFIQVTERKDIFMGSGTLVHPKWILTAAHNFILPEESKILPALSKIRILVGNDPNKPIKTLNVAEIILHPHWINSDGGFEKGTDLALVRLTEAITDIKPSVINYDLIGEKDKSFTWSCGFGDYSQQTGQNKDDFSKKHAMVNVLDRIKSDLKTTVNGKSYNGGLLAFDFDAPDGKYNTLGDNIVNDQERELGKGNSAPEALEMEGGTVSGDSGGPIFIKINGLWTVCGVLHGGIDNVAAGLKDSSFGDISVYCRTASAKDWLQAVIK